MKDFSFSCRRLLPQNIERIREPLNYVDIIEKIFIILILKYVE